MLLYISKMKYLYLSLTCLLISICVECKTNSTEDEKTPKPQKKAVSASQAEVKLTPKQSPAAKTLQVNPNFNTADYNPQIHHIHPGFLQIPSQPLPLDLGYDTISYSGPIKSNFNIQKTSPTKLSYAEAPQQNNPHQNSFILNQDGRRFQVAQTPLQQDSPRNLNTAIGSIAAHILSRNNQNEYVPYPPNGNPNDYSGYFGHNYPTESPLSGAYDRANRGGYGLYPTGVLEKSDPRGYYPGYEHYNDYQNQYDPFGFDFYTNPQNFGHFGHYPNFQTNNINLSNRDREHVSADRRSAVNERGKEPIKRHL